MRGETLDWARRAWQRDAASLCAWIARACWICKKIVADGLVDCLCVSSLREGKFEFGTLLNGLRIYLLGPMLLRGVRRTAEHWKP